jgi:hypothetical protein
MLAGMFKRGDPSGTAPTPRIRGKRRGRTTRLLIALPVAVVLSLQGYEIVCSWSSYALQAKARAQLAQARKILDRSDEKLETAGRLRECKTRIAGMVKKAKDAHLDDLYWWVVMRIDLDDEEMAHDYELYERADAQARKWSADAHRFKERANKYGPISRLMKLI